MNAVVFPSTSARERQPKQCIRCYRKMNIIHFLSRNGAELACCAECRKNQQTRDEKKKQRETNSISSQGTVDRTAKKVVNEADSTISPVVLREHLTLDECGEEIRWLVEEARITGNVYNICGLTHCAEGVAENHVRERILEIAGNIAKFDSHDYSAQQTLPLEFIRGRAIGYFKCCQNARVLERTCREDLIRQSNPAPVFSCDGSLSITLYKSCRIEFSVRYAYAHAVPGPKAVSKAVLDFIAANSELPSSQVFWLLKMKEAADYPEMSYITSRQIDYHLAELQTGKYRRDEDPVKSALVLLRKESGVELMPSTFTDYTSVAFLTPIFRTAGGSGQFDRSYFVDSTYGTNHAGMKLFVFMTTVEDKALPISYLNLSKVDVAGGKIAALVEWFEFLRSCGICPQFLFTDKDQAEISAAKTVWPRSKIQLCL